MEVFRFITNISAIICQQLFNFHDYTIKITNIFFFHRSDIITKQNEILRKRQKNKLGKYMLYYSYEHIFCKIHALKVLLY